MQDSTDNETWANQMDTLPAFSMLPNPDEGFGGAEAGSASRLWSCPALPGTYFVTETKYGGPFVDGHGIQQKVPSQTSYCYDAIGGFPPDFGNEACLTDNGATTAGFLTILDPQFISSEGNIGSSVGSPFPDGSGQTYPTMQAALSHLPSSSLGDSNQAFPMFSMQNSPVPPAAQDPIQCVVIGCRATFKRTPDRLRHEAAVHGINQLLQLYLCPVNGCSKSQGSGYTRKDKLTEHLWKKHGNLGYTKRV